MFDVNVDKLWRLVSSSFRDFRLMSRYGTNKKRSRHSRTQLTNAIVKRGREEIAV